MNLTADDLDYLRTILPGPGKVKDAHRAAYTRLMRAVLDAGSPAVDPGPMDDLHYVASLSPGATVALRARVSGDGTDFASKIAHIKVARDVAGWGLREAKEAVEGSGLTFTAERGQVLTILSRTWNWPGNPGITGAQVFEVVR